ncbi:MAG: alpha-L-fucosidase [Prevotella sp.]|nr:alpha-L-fucosidase [Prevotella sp.]
MRRYFISILGCLIAATCLNAQSAAAVSAPAPVSPLPQPKQVAWQQLETYAFIHFGLNTFGDREWGYGDADLNDFNPTRLDCEQWARVCKEAGMRGIIITAKHHDGFCLWQTKYTDYSIRNTPYKDGKGDIVGELSAACKKYGLKFGVYLSPWDRHQAFYGTPLYREYFHAQLEELLTQYGDIFEVWFDGANGGDGYYGGARDTRTIDRRTYYDYPRAWQTVERLQPMAVCFSDGGPGCRWVGNEQGYAFATNWSFLRINEVYPGYDRYKELQQGHADGDTWVAAECNTSIRPGWFYHKREDEKVKRVDKLVDLYYRSVGHNGTFLLNFPVTPEGLIHPIDSANAVDFYKHVRNELRTNLIDKAKVKTSAERGTDFKANNLKDNNYNTYWATPDNVITASISIKFSKREKVNRMMLQEYIPLGQRVKSFTVEYLTEKGWQNIDAGEETTTIGYKRLLRFPTITTKEMRIRIADSRGPICLSELGAYYAQGGDRKTTDDWMETKGYDFEKTETTESILADLGNTKIVSSLHYKPSSTGIITHYEILTGETLDNMQTAAKGEFSNIRNNPIMQDVYFTPVSARYVMLRATKTVIPNEPIKYETILIK